MFMLLTFTQSVITCSIHEYVLTPSYTCACELEEIISIVSLPECSGLGSSVDFGHVPSASLDISGREDACRRPTHLGVMSPQPV